MPSPPTTPIGTDKVDGGTDKIGAARAQLYAALQALNTLMQCYGVADGFCMLDANARALLANLPIGPDLEETPTAGVLGSAAFMDHRQIPLNLAAMEKTSAYTVTPADHGRALFVTGTTTITLPAAADVSSVFVLPVKNYGVNTVTIAASGSDTIDGAASITLAAGVTRWVLFYSSTAWRTL